ncbi:hypothetical protein D3C87_475830 [compost metagenome]
MNPYTPTCPACRTSDMATFYKSCQGCQARRAQVMAVFHSTPDAALPPPSTDKPRVRYVLHIGPVRSATDGDVHSIGAAQLAKLYGVPFSDCVVYDPNRPETVVTFKPLPGDVHLWTRGDGNYTLPEPKPTWRPKDGAGWRTRGR